MSKLKGITETNIVETMRLNLSPQGSKDLVEMSLINRYFDGEFIKECLDELERKTSIVYIGMDKFSKLELLAIALLQDSAGIESLAEKKDSDVVGGE
jgi:hypothetical protein